MTDVHNGSSWVNLHVSKFCFSLPFSCEGDQLAQQTFVKCPECSGVGGSDGLKTRQHIPFTDFFITETPQINKQDNEKY